MVQFYKKSTCKDRHVGAGIQLSLKYSPGHQHFEEGLYLL